MMPGTQLLIFALLIGCICVICYLGMAMLTAVLGNQITQHLGGQGLPYLTTLAVNTHKYALGLPAVIFVFSTGTFFAHTLAWGLRKICSESVGYVLVLSVFLAVLLVYGFLMLMALSLPFYAMISQLSLPGETKNFSRALIAESVWLVGSLLYALLLGACIWKRKAEPEPGTVVDKPRSSG